MYLAVHTGLPQTTIWQILECQGLNRPSWIDRFTGRVIHGDERSAPGALVHLESRKDGRVVAGPLGRFTAADRLRPIAANRGGANGHVLVGSFRVWSEFRVADDDEVVNDRLPDALQLDCGGGVLDLGEPFPQQRTVRAYVVGVCSH